MARPEPERLTGGCHCGAVRFAVVVRERVALRCNCSICAMKGFVHVIVPGADFSLLSGADALTTYRFNTGVAQHTFCKVCGVQAHYVPRSHPDGFSVSLPCLDVDPATFRIEDFDGQNWERNVATIR